MASGWYDLDIGSFLTPYLGVGAGGTNLSVSLTTDDDTWFDGAGWGFAFQAGAGVALRVVAGFSLDIGYRFFGTLQTEVFDDADPTSAASVPQSWPTASSSACASPPEPPPTSGTRRRGLIRTLPTIAVGSATAEACFGLFPPP